MLLLQQMIVLFILMGIGYFCYRKAIITDEVSKKLSAIVVNIANPALILTGCMGEDRIQGKELLLTGGIMLAMYAVLLILADRLFQYRIYGISCDIRFIWKRSIALCGAFYDSV